MNSNKIEYNKKLLDEIGLYLSFAQDAYIDRKPYIITEAHEIIKKSNYKDDCEYYNELTDYIIIKLYENKIQEA